MANRITILDRQLEHAHAEREIYRTQMLDMKARLDAALFMLQLNVPVGYHLRSRRNMAR